MSSDMDLLFGGKKSTTHSSVVEKPKEELKPSPTPMEKAQSVNQPVNQSIVQSTDQSTAKSTTKSKNKPTKQSTHQSIYQSSSQSSSRLTNRQTVNKIVDRPKGFYILERIDRYLDDSVRFYQEKHNIRKVDRSVIVNAILDDKELWTDESLDRLVDRVISQLTSRLTGQ